jgi:hypothetical protein
VEVWREHICKAFLNLSELSILRRCHTFFEKYWQNVMRKNVIRVPQGCSTVRKAMNLALIFSGRKEYTTDDPLKIQIDEGFHKTWDWKQKRNGMKVTCSHITFVGKGKAQTTICGGFNVVDQQNVKFEELTVMNRSGHGLWLSGHGTNVDVLKCVVKECRGYGMYVRDGATVTATQCEFMENMDRSERGASGVCCKGINTKTRLNNCTMHQNTNGLVADDHAVVDLHGTKTDIHSNNCMGITALSGGKVNIHLPSQHNTTHDNDDEDRDQEMGGSIANINADGVTFTHVDDDDDDEDDY